MQIIGLDKALRKVTSIQKQVKFATAQALNDTAKDVQSGELKNLGQKFTLRSKGAPWQKPGTKFGVNIRPFATKDRPVAVIGSQADWLREHEKGGLKKTAGGHRVAIPTAFWKARQEIMASNKKPRAILKNLQRELRAAQLTAGETHVVNKHGNVVLKSQRSRMASLRLVNRIQKQIALAGSLQHAPFIPTGGVKEGIYVRTSANRLPIKRLFTFEKNVGIQPKLGFEPLGRLVAQRTYQKHFDLRLLQAIATAK